MFSHIQRCKVQLPIQEPNFRQKNYPRKCMICGNNRFTTKQRKCQNQLKETQIIEISFNCTYISLNFSLKYYCSSFPIAFTQKYCKNVTTNGVCDKTPCVMFGNLPRIWKFYTNLVHMVCDFLQLCSPIPDIVQKEAQIYKTKLPQKCWIWVESSFWKMSNIYIFIFFSL